MTRKTTQKRPTKQRQNGTNPHPKSPSNTGSRRHKLRQICGPDAHQTANAAAGKRPAFDQTADSFVETESSLATVETDRSVGRDDV